MAILARMYVEEVKAVAWRGSGKKEQEQVKLTAVYSDDPASPNFSFAQATPTATLEMTISNPEAFGYLEPGVEYNIEIQKARTPLSH